MKSPKLKISQPIIDSIKSGFPYTQHYNTNNLKQRDLRPVRPCTFIEETYANFLDREAGKAQD